MKRFRWICIWFGVVLFVGCHSGSEDAPPQNFNQVSVKDDSKPDDFIIGGKSVSESDEIKSTTAVIYNTQIGSLCSASILAEDIIVTAAHCVSGRAENIKVGFGLTMNTVNMKSIQSYFPHQNWIESSTSEKNTFDIALIRYTGGLPKGYRPATLVSNTHIHVKNEDTVLAGYGIANERTSEGAGKLRRVDVTVIDGNFSETEVLLDQTQGKGACHGDSGGPAFVKGRNGKLLLWGVTSRGYGPENRDCSGYVIYTRIAAFNRWIKDATEKMRNKK